MAILTYALTWIVQGREEHLIHSQIPNPLWRPKYVGFSSRPFSPQFPLTTCKANSSQLWSVAQTSPKQQTDCLPKRLLSDDPQAITLNICRTYTKHLLVLPPPCVCFDSPTFLTQVEGIEANIHISSSTHSSSLSLPFPTSHHILTVSILTSFVFPTPPQLWIT